MIGVIGGDALCDAAYGGFGRRVKKTEMQAERIARECQHVAKLATAQDADGHTRFPFFFCAAAAAAGSGLARIRPVCSVRDFRTASRKARCLVRGVEAAGTAALT